MNRITPVVKYILIINIALYILQMFLRQNYGINLHEYLGLNFGDPNKFLFFQFFTYMFMHAFQLNHLLFNMLALWMFGSSIENVMGGKKFLFYYLVCGIGAAMFHIIIEFIGSGFQIPMINMVGASGSIYGILLAFGFLFPNMILQLFFVIPIKAKYMVILAAGVELYLANKAMPGDTVAHLAHLGGMVVGFILLKRWNYKPLY